MRAFFEMGRAKKKKWWKSFVEKKNEVGDSLLFFGRAEIRNSNVGIQIRRFLLPMLAILASVRFFFPRSSIYFPVCHRKKKAKREWKFFALDLNYINFSAGIDARDPREDIEKNFTFREWMKEKKSEVNERLMPWRKLDIYRHSVFQFSSQRMSICYFSFYNPFNTHFHLEPSRPPIVYNEKHI